MNAGKPTQKRIQTELVVVARRAAPPRDPSREAPRGGGGEREVTASTNRIVETREAKEKKKINAKLKLTIRRRRFVILAF